VFCVSESVIMSSRVCASVDVFPFKLVHVLVVAVPRLGKKRGADLVCPLSASFKHISCHSSVCFL